MTRFMTVSRHVAHVDICMTDSGPSRYVARLLITDDGRIAAASLSVLFCHTACIIIPKPPVRFHHTYSRLSGSDRRGLGCLANMLHATDAFCSSDNQLSHLRSETQVICRVFRSSQPHTVIVSSQEAVHIAETTTSIYNRPR